MTDPIDRLDLQTALVGLEWIRRHRELHHQPPSPAIERAINHLSSALAANGQAVQPDSRELLTTAEVAERIGCSKRTARRIAARHGTRHGRQWLVPEAALED